MASLRILLALFLLLLCGRNSRIEGRKDRPVLHRMAVIGLDDVVFREGDNPCKVLKRYCKSISAKYPYDSCFSQLHPVVIQHLTSMWGAVHTKLRVDEGFLIDCAPFDYELSDFTPGVSHGERSKMATRNSSGIIQDMVTLLEQAMQGDTVALQTFNTQRNQLKLTDNERIVLYSQAVLLLPNNLFVVDQFGLALLYLDREEMARKLFSNAVARKLWGNPLQRPVSKYVPGLTSKPWHDKNDYPFIAKLEAGASDVTTELLQNLKQRRHLFTEEQENLHVGGDWSELRIKSSGYGFTELSKFFPKTMKHIKNCGEDFTSIKFSAIQPGTHIRTHTGPTNERLRVHLTLIHKGGARLRVGPDWHTWEEGKAIIFDDSWEHEVIHTGDSIRAVLILDIWHPELPKDQRIIH